MASPRAESEAPKTLTGIKARLIEKNHKDLARFEIAASTPTGQARTNQRPQDYFSSDQWQNDQARQMSLIFKPAAEEQNDPATQPAKADPRKKASNDEWLKKLLSSNEPEKPVSAAMNNRPHNAPIIAQPAANP